MTFEFQFKNDEDVTLENAVYQALGYASVAWDPRPEGVFIPEQAIDAGEKLLAFIENYEVK